MYPIQSAQMLGESEPDAVLELCHCEQVGIGVRSVVPFSPGGVLDQFDGRIEDTVSQHSLQIGPDRHISETQFVGFLSHGCDPNCALNMETRQLVALNDIAAGELLRIDYSVTEDTLYKEFDCACGAQNCRGWITGRLAPEDL